MIGEPNNLDAFDINHSERIDAWLKVATKGLCEPAVVRIEEEIWDYYQSSVHDHIAHGIPNDVAEERALRELGSPAVARRRFFREHLTKRETGLLRGILDSRMRQGSFGRRLSWMNVLVFACLAIGQYIRFNYLPTPIPLIALGMAFVVAVLLVVPSKFLDRKITQETTLVLNLALWSTLYGLLMLGMIGWAMSRPAGETLYDQLAPALMLIVFIVVVPYIVVNSFRTILKLLADRRGNLLRELHAAVGEKTMHNWRDR